LVSESWQRFQFCPCRLAASRKGSTSAGDLSKYPPVAPTFLIRFFEDARRGGAARGTVALFWLLGLNFLFLVLIDRRLPLGLFDAGPSRFAVVATGGITLTLTDLQPYRYLSAVFVPFRILHLGMNLLALGNLGKGLELRLGTARVLLAFHVAGILGFVASRLWYGPVSPTTAGASGAIFGLFGVQVGLLWARRAPGTRELLLEQLGYAAGFALLFPVNNAAHLGGFVAGALLGALFAREVGVGVRESLYRMLAGLFLCLSVISVGLSLVGTLLWSGHP